MRHVFSSLMLALVLTGCQHQPPAYVSRVDSGAAADTAADSQMGPLGLALQREISEALKATAWPELNPSMESVIQGAPAAPEVEGCGSPSTTPGDDCTWGSPDAPVRIVLVGDSIGLSYANPLRLVAENSGGRVQLHIETLPGCQFADDLIDNPDEGVMDVCPARKQHAVDTSTTRNPK